MESTMLIKTYGKCDYCGSVVNTITKLGESAKAQGTYQTQCNCCGALMNEVISYIKDLGFEETKTETQETEIVNSTTIKEETIKQVKVKNKWTSFLMCLFGGNLGIHKFYEGRIGIGLLYLFTYGLFGGGTIVDLVMLLFKKGNTYEVTKDSKAIKIAKVCIMILNIIMFVIYTNANSGA